MRWLGGWVGVAQRYELFHLHRDLTLFKGNGGRACFLNWYLWLIAESTFEYGFQNTWVCLLTSDVTSDLPVVSK
jgi:hypothetical protein